MYCINVWVLLIKSHFCWISLHVLFGFANACSCERWMRLWMLNVFYLIYRECVALSYIYIIQLGCFLNCKNAKDFFRKFIWEYLRWRIHSEIFLICLLVEIVLTRKQRLNNFLSLDYKLYVFSLCNCGWIILKFVVEPAKIWPVTFNFFHDDIFQCKNFMI